MSQHVSPAQNTAKLQSAVHTVKSNHTPEVQILSTAMAVLQTSSSLRFSGLGTQLGSTDRDKINMCILLEHRACFQELSYTSWHQMFSAEEVLFKRQVLVHA